jgi:hypothetical protein
LGVAKPDAVKAGEKGSWVLKFVPAKTVSQRQRIFLYVYGGRHNKISNYKYKWGNLQTKDHLKEGYVCLKNELGEKLQPIGISDDGGTLAFAVPKEGLKRGEEITAELGGVAGVVAPMFSSPNKFFLLLEASPAQELRAPVLYGEALERIVGACLMHVVGNGVRRLRAYAKSKAVVGEQISLLVRPEDEYGNVASEELGPLVVQLNGREVKAQRVPVKASTCCMLRGVVLQKPGVYRLQVTDISRDLKSFTNPIQCHAAPSSSGVLWGMIHGHTEISDGTGSLDHYFSYMRDECSLDFGATGDHDQLSETSDDIWQLAQETVAKNNEPGRFTAFLGYEWATWRMDGDGDRNVYYLYDRRPMYRMDDGCYPAPKDLFKALESETALIIPHHTAYRGSFCDWKDHETEKERLVEIYSVWGNSECSVNQGNPYPVKGGVKDEKGSSEAPAGFVQRALELGWRVGFTAGGDDHLGHAGDQIVYWSYKAGLMAVYAQQNTRESIWDAMWNRRCYGTTGARIIVDFQIDSHPMGSELLLSEHPELALKRKLSVSIHGTEQIESAQIVRNNKDVNTRRAKSRDVTFDWNDTEPLADINLSPAPYCSVPFTFYYLRVHQKDGEMAWASPIWILSNQTC